MACHLVHHHLEAQAKAVTEVVLAATMAAAADMEADMVEVMVADPVDHLVGSHTSLHSTVGCLPVFRFATLDVSPRHVVIDFD